MKKTALMAILAVFAVPMDSWAYRDHGPLASSASGQAFYRPERSLRARLKMPVRFPMDRPHEVKPDHPIHPGHRPDHRRRDRHRYAWPVTSTVVQEPPTIVIVNPPAAEAPAPPPEPQKVWVPPVMGTRTEPGYWDYGIKKVWMGDHWRFEQDLDDKTWVPDSQWTFVVQAGYWKFAE
ncbi:MAG TPA: hypothetical protein VLT88_03015 [Desulfosarcina sp.]|nr:hypothetical protein [Desulfosarcina sp.]